MSIETARGIGDAAAEEIRSEILAMLRRASKRIADHVGGLDVDARGNIRPTAANIRRIAEVLDRSAGSLFDARFARAVTRYVQGLEGVSAAVTKALEDLGGDGDIMRAIARRTKRDAAAMLLSVSSYRSALGAIADQMTMGIVTSARVTDVLRAVQEAVAEADIDPAPASQVQSAPSMMQRAQTAAASEKAGIVFYRYQGRPIKTTRPWCREREGHVYHVEEIREWGRRAESGKATWDGMVDGTNEQTIFTYLGGWYGNRSSCRHVLVPVLPSRVPQQDMDRMIAKGLIRKPERAA